jgi:hypothetical protein
VANKDFYPPAVTEEADQLLKSRINLVQQAQRLPMNKCKLCDAPFFLCACPGRPMYLQTLNAIEQSVFEGDTALVNLARHDFVNSFNVGDSFKLDKYNWCGLRLYLKYTVIHSFTAADTRPVMERHVRAGNTRFYVFEASRLRARFLGVKIDVPREFLSFIDVPTRDLIVSEDCMRTTRRASLAGNFATTVTSIFENNMSVPINDPTITRMYVNPLKDSSFLVQSFASERLVPYGLF